MSLGISLFALYVGLRVILAAARAGFDGPLWRSSVVLWGISAGLSAATETPELSSFALMGAALFLMAETGANQRIRRAWREGWL